MPLIKNNNTISDIYKGSTKIDSIYKGTNLVYSSGTWEEYLYNYIYYSLVPQTVNSLSVQNKAKLDTIYGNSVVENQLAKNGNFADTNGWSIQSGTFTIANNSLSGSINEGVINGQVYQSLTTSIGNKYLIFFNITTNQDVNGAFVRINYPIDSYNFNLTANTKTFISCIINSVNATQNFSIAPFGFSGPANNSFVIENVNVIDLTLMFGTGNEPTDLTDTRIQALLNRGYIPYNTGEIKSSEISSLSSQGYNIFDGELELGYLSIYGTYNASNTDILSQNFIQVIPSRTYYVNADNFSHTHVFVCEYDKDQNYISGTRRNIFSTHSFQTSQETRYVKFWFYSGGTTYGEVPSNTQVYLSLVDNGYSAYIGTNTLQLPAPVQLNGAINTHDTFEITSSAYVFTKNVGSYTFSGTESFSIGGAISSGLYRYYTLAIPSMKSGEGLDGLCDKYATDKGGYNSATSPCIRFGQSNYALYFYLTQDYSQGSDVATTISGTKIIYPLATPQTITIPKKHLGVVDLGTRNWVQRSGSSIFYAQDFVNTKRAGALYCVLYSHDTENQIANIVNMSMWNTTEGYGANAIVIRNDNYNDATDFKNAMSGVYLFYETEDEVSDFTNSVKVEYGGTLTTNWFSWVKNQQILASDLRPTSSFTYQGVTFSRDIANNSITVSGLASATMTMDISASIATTSSHIYYLYTGVVGAANTYHVVELSSNTKIVDGEIIKLFNKASLRLGFYVGSGQNISFTFKPMLIDLTLAFGSGNEPKSVNDPRMKYIKSLGYIENDILGTTELVDAQVLPNVNVELKCK